MRSDDMLYSAFDIAHFCVENNLDAVSQIELLSRIYKEEHNFLKPECRGSEKSFILDVLYYMDYIVDKQNTETELEVLESDLDFAGLGGMDDKLRYQPQSPYLFFMSLRIKIKYISKRGCLRMKLRTLLRNFGYQRRNDRIMDELRAALIFYHIDVYSEGIICDIRQITFIDTMLTLRTS